MATKSKRELEAPADLVEDLVAVLIEDRSDANADLVVETVSLDPEERTVPIDPETLGLLLLTIVGHVNDVVEFSRTIGEALSRWRKRRRENPSQHTTVDIRVRRADGDDEYYSLSGEMSDEALQRVRDALAKALS